MHGGRGGRVAVSAGGAGRITVPGAAQAGIAYVVFAMWVAGLFQFSVAFNLLRPRADPLLSEVCPQPACTAATRHTVAWIATPCFSGHYCHRHGNTVQGPCDLCSLHGGHLVACAPTAVSRYLQGGAVPPHP